MDDMKLLHGDCLELMKEIPDGSVDMILTDPPYSSGGMHAGDRKKPTKVKYTNCKYNGAARFADFSGDNMDQRAFIAFMREVFYQCKAKTKQGGIIASFVDWRNLPALTDALQMAGIIWLGIVVWDKCNSRPMPDRFRNDCEYIVWGSNGRRQVNFVPGCFVGRGCYSIASVSSKQKHHQTEKPVELLQNLVAICPEGGTVLDPFMGSGSTGIACMNTGRKFIGMEIDEEYFMAARERIQQECAQVSIFE